MKKAILSFLEDNKYIMEEKIIIKEKQYNYCMDFVKGIACVLVVFMHCEFPGVFGTIVQTIARWVLPFFFMVSGFYSYTGDAPFNAKKQLRKIKHIFNITLFASVFYFIVAIIQNGFSLSISKYEIFNWAVFNKPIIIAGQLWFLFALLYVYVIFAFIKRFNLIKLAYIAMIVLTIGYICLAQGMHLIGHTVPNYYYRNFVFEAFPWFMFGHFINEYKDKFKISNKVLISIIVACTVLNLVERYLLGRDFGVNITSFPQATAIFVFSVNNPKILGGVVQRVGKKLSMFIYIIHPFVWHSMESIYARLQINENTFFLYIMPILVLIGTFVLSIACVLIKDKIANKKRG